MTEQLKRKIDTAVKFLQNVCILEDRIRKLFQNRLDTMTDTI